MGNDPILHLLVGFVLGVVLVAGLAYVLDARRCREVKSRLAKLDQARHLAAEQVGQARRQVEQLQRECQALRHHARVGARASAPMPLEPESPVVDAAEAVRRYHIAHDTGQEDEDERERAGFPDTLILRRS